MFYQLRLRASAGVQVLLQAKKPRYSAGRPTASPGMCVACLRRREGILDALRGQQVVEVCDLARIIRTLGSPDTILGCERRFVGVDETLVQLIIVLEIA
jgi:hypothetical protein